jgi:hypothetical protein
MKKYLVKVYDNTGSYITTWDDVVSSDIEFNNEINTGGGQLRITLARNAGDYGEGTDVDFDHNVKVFCYDAEQPNGVVVFQGYISAYTPIYKNNSVQIIVLGYGSQLNDMMIEGPEVIDITQNTGTNYKTSYYYYNIGTVWRAMGQTFQPTSNQILTGITVGLGLDEDPAIPSINVRAFICSTFPTVNNINNPPTGDETPYTLDYQLAVSEPVAVTNEDTRVEYRFNFSTQPELVSGQTYLVYILPEWQAGGAFNPIQVYYRNSNVYANGEMWDGSYTGMGAPAWGNSTVGDIYFITHYSTGATFVPFTSEDPSDILRGIIDAYRAKGGDLTYDGTSIDDTGTTVSYTFNVNTSLEGVKKCLEIAPANWYWYIDYATNTIHFHEKSETPDHTFTLERDLLDAKFEKRTEDIVNVIYFTGGDTGGGVNFFKKYTIDASIQRYGHKSLKYTDGRVTNEATADTIANSILEIRSEPELRVTLEVLDSNNEQGLGYDIESIRVGDVVAVRNISQQVGLSTWDVARWDDAYWDFNVYNLSSLQMQVQRVAYAGDKATVYASTLAPDVNKRIEDINRNLEALQTANNPTTPT